MTLTQWFIVFIVIQIIHGLATWKLYIKAGRQAWEAFIPIYNAVILMKIINRPGWWTILLFLPIVNLIMFPVIWVETARSFGKNSTLDSWLSVLSLGFYNFHLNYAAPDVNYIEDRSLKPKTELGDWVSSILFAIVAATIVHTYFIQPFVIPSSSLEKTLLVGDFLFVSKFHYGARVPQTTVGLPMVHDSIPVLKKKSYLFDDHYEKRNTSWKNKLQLPYLRIPGFEKIDRNEIVVFNQPADTLLDMNDFTPDRNYYKPIDKKTNLVKRCVGVPGDSLEIRNGYVYINGKQNVLPERAKLQFAYWIEPKQSTFSNKFLAERYGITDAPTFVKDNRMYYFPAIADEALETFKNHPNVGKVIPVKQEKGIRDENVFPLHPDYNWNTSNFGPIYIPEAGKTVPLNLEVLPLYKRIIQEYEGNTIGYQGNQILINGTPKTSYTFKQNYYWMMGDNRNNSLDARAWGYVPFNHVVGKPVLVWMSWDTNGKGFNKIRWKRLFTTVGGSGKPTSYLIPVLILFGLIYGFNKWRKSKKSLQ